MSGAGYNVDAQVDANENVFANAREVKKFDYWRCQLTHCAGPTSRRRRFHLHAPDCTPLVLLSIKYDEGHPSSRLARGQARVISDCHFRKNSY
jgi:hypothetical protein